MGSNVTESHAVRGYVSGGVQGVSFRASLRYEASVRGLTGWVRNTPDGRVEFQAQGDRRSIRALLDWARVGPPAARVDALVAEAVPVDATLTRFEIRR